MANARFDIQSVRAQFPALESGFVYGDNAGGSQILRASADKIYDYLLHTNCQLGATYPDSEASTARVAEGVEAVRELFGAARKEEVVFGGSSTALFENVARGLEYGWTLKEGDEVVVMGEHEANVGPWRKLATRMKLPFKVWTPSRQFGSVKYDLDTLGGLLSSRTRIVAFSACSNILGSVNDVKAIVSYVRTTVAELGGRGWVITSVDCVAYAPHRKMDVVDWDVDFCAFSLYKVYGPHVSALYAHTRTLLTLESHAHFFLTAYQGTANKINANPSYEAAWGSTAIPAYIKSLTPSGTLDAGFKAIQAHEQALIRPLLKYLASKDSVGIMGTLEGEDMVPTISFVSNTVPSKKIIDATDAAGGVGIRWGHFYAFSLCSNARYYGSVFDKIVKPDDGVVRISLVHYNTSEEVERIIRALDTVL